MATPCTRCESTGFLNVHQIPEELLDDWDFEAVQKWIEDNDDHDVSACDCCGNGEDAWHGTPGEHYNNDDPQGPDGPYADNGGLCECH